MKQSLRKALIELVEETRKGTSDVSKHKRLIESIEKHSAQSEVVFSDEGTDHEGYETKEEVREMLVDVDGKSVSVWLGLFESEGMFGERASEIYLVKPKSILNNFDWVRNEVDGVDELLG